MPPTWLRYQQDRPLCFMTYYNPILSIQFYRLLPTAIFSHETLFSACRPTLATSPSFFPLRPSVPDIQPPYQYHLITTRTLLEHLPAFSRVRLIQPSLDIPTPMPYLQRRMTLPDWFVTFPGNHYLPNTYTWFLLPDVMTASVVACVIRYSAIPRFLLRRTLGGWAG